MGAEANDLKVKQEALDTTVTDLVRIVGRLDKKVDAGFNKLAFDVASVKVDTMSLRQRLDEMHSENTQIKETLNLILSKLPA